MATQNPSRSPSPLPPPPIPTTPGPRATALTKLYADAIAHVLKTCSPGNFAACFPTAAARVPGAVRLLHEQFVAKLGESLRREFESVLAEREVVPALNELDRVVEEARRRKERAAKVEGGGGKGEVPTPVAAHTLPPRRLYVSSLAPSLREYREEMELRQRQLGEENAELMERVERQRGEIRRLVEGLEGVVADLAGSVAVLHGEEVRRKEEEERS